MTRQSSPSVIVGMGHYCVLALIAVSCFASSSRAQSSSSTASAQCVPTPISAAISNVTVANSPNNAMARGVAISVGTPLQRFAFMPYWWNNSLVYDDTDLCYVASATMSQDSCITIRGGAYEALSSKTQKQGHSDATANDISPFPSTSLYSDTWTLNDQVALPNYTFGVPQNDWGEQFYYPQAVLGLGTNSTFLNALKAENMIASRTWSFFWGRDGTGAQSNGSMVFGGYDQDKVSGTTNYTAKLNYTSCAWGTQVEISALGVFFLNGTTVSMFDDSSDSKVPLPLYGCIDPGRVGMLDIPYNDYFANFVSYTDYQSFDENELGGSKVRSTGLNFWDLLYLPGVAPFEGDVSVTIKDGPSVKVTNDQLVVPHVYMDQSTSSWQQNGSLSDLRLASLGEAGVYSSTPMTMDRHFMTFVYLMVNLDAGEFTLWPANSDSTAEDLIAVDENNQPVQDSTICPTPTAASATASASADITTATGSSQTANSALSRGTIAGIAVGAAAGVVLAALGVYFLFRRKRQGPGKGAGSQPAELAGQTDPKQGPSDDSKVHSYDNTMYSSQYGEESPGVWSPSELSGTQRYELQS